MVAEYDLELLWEFIFQGNKFSCDCFDQKLKKENFDVLKMFNTLIGTEQLRLQHCISTYLHVGHLA